MTSRFIDPDLEERLARLKRDIEEETRRTQKIVLESRQLIEMIKEKNIMAKKYQQLSRQSVSQFLIPNSGSLFNSEGPFA